MSGSRQLFVAAVLFLSACFSTSSAFALPTENLELGQWSLISIPADPGATGTVQGVFGDDLPVAGYGINWLVYGFDSRALEYRLLALNERLEANKGYWVFQNVNDPAEIDVPDSLAPLTGTEQTGCVEDKLCASVALSSNANVPVWNAIGYSSDSEALFGDTRFVTASGACAQGCTPTEAQSANVAQSVMFALNSEGTAYEVISEDTPMLPWDGFWLLVLPDADQLRWVVPVANATPPAGNQPPVAVNDTAGPLDAGERLAIDVTANDTDADGQIIASTVSIVEPPAFGTATVTAGGVVSYSHNGATDTGADSFTYTVEDDSGAVSNVATVNIAPINDPGAPVLPELTDPLPGTQLSGADVTFNWDDNGVEVEQWYLRIGLTEGSADGSIPGSTEFAEVRLTNPATTEFQVSGLPTNGVPVFVEFSFRQGGVWTKRNFEFQAFDSSPVNQAPVANDDSAGPLIVGQNISVDVLANDTDADGTVNQTTVAIASQPSAGSVVVESNGQITYTHDAASGAGSDSFTYTVQDDAGAISNVATVSITPITDPDQPVLPELTDPLPGTQLSGADVTFMWDDNGIAVEQWFVRIGLTEGSANGAIATSAEFAEIRLTNPATMEYQATGLPTNGVPIFVEFSFRKDGIWTIRNFEYQAFDSDTVNQNEIALNDDDFVGVAGGRSVTGNVTINDTITTDSEQQSLVFDVTEPPNSGTATINADTGAFEYTPASGFTGDDFFVYSLVQLDENQNPLEILASARVNIRINALVLVEDSLNALSGVQTIDNVVSNDTLPGNAAELGLRLQVIEQPVNGFVDMDSISGAYVYVSNPGYSGPDDFVYGVLQVDENEQNVAELARSSVNVDVESIVVEDDQFAAISGQAFSGVVADNDSLPQAAAGQGLLLLVRTEPENGSVEMSALTGEFTYVSSDNFAGQDSFSYALVQVDQQGTEIGVISEDAQVLVDVSAPVTFYSEVDYQGSSWSTTLGSSPNLSDTPAGNNQISSMRIASGFVVTACASFELTGECNTYAGDVSQLVEFNDRISSLQVTQSPVDVESSVNGTLRNYRISGIPGVVTGDTVMPELELPSDQGFVVIQQPLKGTVFMSAAGNYLYTPGEKFVGTDVFQYALVRFNQFGGVVEQLAEAFVVIDYAEGILFFESESANFDNAIGTYDLDANGNPTSLRLLLLNSNNADFGSVLDTFNGLPRLFLFSDFGDQASVNDTLTWDGNNGILVNGSVVSSDVIWDNPTLNSTGLTLVNYEPTPDGELLIRFEDQIDGGDFDGSDAVLRLNFDPVIAR
ncbi:MAG: Ig-like domain-containing protein [Granulosicoccus sp.]